MDIFKTLTKLASEKNASEFGFSDGIPGTRTGAGVGATLGDSMGGLNRMSARALDAFRGKVAANSSIEFSGTGEAGNDPTKLDYNDRHQVYDPNQSDYVMPKSPMFMPANSLEHQTGAHPIRQSGPNSFTNLPDPSRVMPAPGVSPTAAPSRATPTHTPAVPAATAPSAPTLAPHSPPSPYTPKTDTGSMGKSLADLSSQAHGQMGAKPQPAAGAGYEIRRGDNLSGIAKSHHTTVDSLMASNPQIKDKNMIQAGGHLSFGAPAEQQAASNYARHGYQGGFKKAGLSWAARRAAASILR